jgi:prepilin-type N-terminal cleavage/methylation domain-containing protein
MIGLMGLRLRRGVTLTEVVLAAAILGLVATGSTSAMLVASRMSRNALEDMVAMEFVNRQTELIKSNRFYNTLGTTQFTAGETFQYDPADFGARNLPTFTVNYAWYGFGFVTSSTGSSISFDQTGWPADVNFAGHRVLLRPTAAQGTSSAIAQIVTHTNGRFVTNSAFNGWQSGDWEFAIPNGMYFEVDGGKWCRMTITWTPRGGRGTRTYVRDVFVPWRQDQQL